MIYPLLQPTGAPDSPTQWLLIGGAVLVILFTVFRPSLRRKDPLAKGPPASLAQQRSVERQMQNLLVELSDMARQISAQLDTRAAKLDLLIREADGKIAEMNRMLAAGGGNGDHSGEGGASPSAPRQTDAAGSADSTADMPPAAAEQVDPRHAQIYAMIDEGRSIAQIAQQLGRPSGEIELILALRPKP